MANSLHSTRLLVWCFGTFHTILLFVALLLLLYTRGIVGDLLASLSTLLGVGAFTLLWSTTWWSTRRAVRELGQRTNFPQSPLSHILLAGAKWSAVNGLVFFLLFLIVYALILILNSLFTSRFEILGLLVFVACFGVIIAPIIGGLIGILFALLDYTILRLAAWLFRHLLAPPMSDAATQVG